MPWQPPADQREYYSIASPAATQSVVRQLLTPLLGSPASDPTFGRASLPRSPEETYIRTKYNHKDGRVELDETNHGNEYISYQVWYANDDVKHKHADLLFIHGINDYGGKFACHAEKFLKAGYRVIVPDLPSHGRSTGIHCHLTAMSNLAQAVYLVLADVLLQDSKLVKDQQGFKQTRKMFVAGQSLGGFTAVLTCLSVHSTHLSARFAIKMIDSNHFVHLVLSKYGSSEVTDLPVKVEFRPQISGGLFLCPMLAISPETRPHMLVEMMARGLSSFASCLPFAAANKGKNSEDPSIEEQFEMDPQTYHGKLRIGTGLAILQGLEQINDNQFQHLKIPFIIFHGTGDRVTSYHGSEVLYEQAMSQDKEIKLLDKYEHILLREGKDEQDDQRRQTVLNGMLDWLDRHQ
ncbi:hypothetical protein OIO90_001187 [Microbotryomycetes sp. JL221]|nr:hypothetical protein OIO90_001187 [Microbotryomycetes sp. JL221]